MMYIIDTIVVVAVFLLFLLTLVHKRQMAGQREKVMMENAVFLPHVTALTDEGYKVVIPLRGFSMRPFLEDGRDKALLERIDEPLKVGDVVLSELSPGRYALHRLIMVSDTHVQMLGDGNLNPDPVIPIGQVKAIAKGFYRKGGARLERVDGAKFRFYSWAWMKLGTWQRRWFLRLWRRVPALLRDFSFEGLANKDNKRKVINIRNTGKMRIKPGFQLHEVCGENIIMAMGEETIDFSQIIALNESSLLIWNKMNEGVDNIDDLVKCITDEYDVDDETARRDITELLHQLIQNGVVEE